LWNNFWTSLANTVLIIAPVKLGVLKSIQGYFGKS
jgi:hypothetical protein